MEFLIFLNGEPPENLNWVNFRNKVTIFTDGAVHYAKEMNVTPNIVLGDFDSISDLKDLQDALPQCQFILTRDQNKTDFEKALEFCKSKKVKEGMVFGLHGKDIDHSFHNLNLFIHYSEQFKLQFYHDLNLNVPQWGFPILESQSLMINCDPGIVVSVLPMPFAQMTSQGLTWELLSKKLQVPNGASVRNCSKTSQVHFKCEKGKALIVISSHSKPSTL